MYEGLDFEFHPLGAKFFVRCVKLLPALVRNITADAKGMKYFSNTFEVYKNILFYFSLCTLAKFLKEIFHFDWKFKCSKKIFLKKNVKVSLKGNWFKANTVTYNITK